MVIALVSQDELSWIVEHAEGRGHSILHYTKIEEAVEAIRSGDDGIEAVLVNVHGTEEANLRRLKRIARQAGIPAEQVMIRDPRETSAPKDIRRWLEELT